MKRLTKCICVNLALLIIFMLFSTIEIHSHSSIVDQNTFPGLFMDLPAHYTLQESSIEFTAADFNLFETMFTESNLFNDQIVFKRSFFANTGKTFLLEHKVSKQQYILVPTILSVIVIYNTSEEYEYGMKYYISEIICQNRDRFLFTHLREDVFIPLAGALYDSGLNRIWKWKPSDNKQNGNRVDLVFQEISTDLESHQLSHRVEPLSALFSSWYWRDYLNQYLLPNQSSADVTTFSWDDPIIPKAPDSLLQYLSDHYVIEGVNYTWTEIDTKQALRYIGKMFNDWMDQRNLTISFKQAYQISNQSENSIYIPYVSFKFKIGSASVGYGFSALKNNAGIWSFWVSDCFYFPDQTFVKTKTIMIDNTTPYSYRDPFFQYLVIIGMASFEKIHPSNVPTILLAFASSLYHASLNPTANASSTKPYSQVTYPNSAVLHCEPMMLQFMNQVNMLSDTQPIEEADQFSLANILVSMDNNENAEITSVKINLLRQYKIYNRDTNETYRFFPNMTCNITLQNGRQLYYYLITALQNANHEWLLLDMWLWKTMFHNGVISYFATRLSDADEPQTIYLAYQLHYSYLVRQGLSAKEITDFTLLFSASMWSKYLFNFSLPDAIPTKNHAYQPTLPNLSSLMTYVSDHYTYERDFDFQMSRRDQEALLSIFQARLKDITFPLDWSTFQINYSYPYKVIGENGKPQWYFNKISLSVKGESNGSASSQQSWFKDENGYWICFSPLYRMESSEGWLINSINLYSKSFLSAYMIYLGYFARANWEQTTLAHPDLIPLICSLDLTFNRSHYDM